MKTRASFFKFAFMMFVITSTMVSCGKDNVSGAKKSVNGYTGGPGTYHLPSGGTMSYGQVLDVVRAENPCRINSGYGYNQNQNNQARTEINIPLNGINVNAGSRYIGVTPEGDIAIVENYNGPRMQLLLCARPDLSGQGSLMSNPVLNASQRCPVSEVTAADVMLGSNSGYGNYQLKFAPIHIPGTDRYSSLCQ